MRSAFDTAYLRCNRLEVWRQPAAGMPPSRTLSGGSYRVRRWPPRPPRARLSTPQMSQTSGAGESAGRYRHGNPLNVVTVRQPRWIQGCNVEAFTSDKQYKLGRGMKAGWAMVSEPTPDARPPEMNQIPTTSEARSMNFGQATASGHVRQVGFCG